MRLLRGSPGQTATEYTRRMVGMPYLDLPGLSLDFYERRQQIRRRLTDLKNKGLAIRIGAAGEGEVRWFPIRLDVGQGG